MEMCTAHAPSYSRLDESAIETLITEVAELAEYFAGFCVRQESVGDLAQDVVLDCLEMMRSNSWAVPHAEIGRFVRTLVWRRTVDAARRRVRRGEREAEHMRELSEGTHAWMSPELLYEDRELRELQQRALAEIPEACRRAYVLVREHGLTYEEAGALLGLKPRAIASHIVRAQRRFRIQLEREGIRVPFRKSDRGKQGVRKPADARCGAGESRRTGLDDDRLTAA